MRHMQMTGSVSMVGLQACILRQAAQVRAHVGRELAKALRPELEAVVATNDDPPGMPFSPEAPAAARRAAKNKGLSYLAMLDDADVIADLLKRFKGAENMTDQVAVLLCTTQAVHQTSTGSCSGCAGVASPPQSAHDRLIFRLQVAILEALNDTPGTSICI